MGLFSFQVLCCLHQCHSHRYKPCFYQLPLSLLAWNGLERVHISRVIFSMENALLKNALRAKILKHVVREDVRIARMQEG